jgi:hypothetical protein
MAGATGVEPAASCVTGRSLIGVKERVPNVGEHWRAKGLLCEETADTRSTVCRKSVTGQRSNRLVCHPRQMRE